MPATLDQLNAAINLVHDALKKIQAIEKNVSTNIEVQQHIDKAYSELQQASIKLTAESALQ